MCLAIRTRTTEGFGATPRDFAGESLDFVGAFAADRGAFLEGSILGPRSFTFRAARFLVVIYSPVIRILEPERILPFDLVESKRA